MSAPIPSSEQIDAMFGNARREQEFWARNYRRLVADYPDQFIAVRESKVVATGSDLEELMGNVAALGLSYRAFWSRFMMTTPVHYVL
jgi:hypothetical protein